MAKAQVTIPLGIPDIRVLKTEAGERGEIIITVESTKGGTVCRKCGKWITKAHGRDELVTIRHLPVFGHPSHLRYRPKRYQCQDCEGHPTTTEKLEWHDANSSHSFAYDHHILLQLVNSTIEDVSIKEGISYERVAGALERGIEAEVDWRAIREIEILGLDEIALKKGQRDYVTLVTGQFQDGEITVLGVLAGHEKAELVEFYGRCRNESCKPSRMCAVSCGKLTSKRSARKSRPSGSSPIVFTLPGIIGKPPIKSEKKNFGV